MRMDHSKETLTIKMQVLPFKGGKLVDGAPMAKYPEYDPPGGGRWIYSGKKFGFGGGVLTPPAQRSERPMYAGPLGVRPDVPPASL